MFLAHNHRISATSSSTRAIGRNHFTTLVGAHFSRMSPVVALNACLATSHGKITKQYSQYCAVALSYVHECEPSYVCPGHDIKLHPQRVKYINCVRSGLVLAKALT